MSSAYAELRLAEARYPPFEGHHPPAQPASSRDLAGACTRQSTAALAVFPALAPRARGTTEKCVLRLMGRIVDTFYTFCRNPLYCVPGLAPVRPGRGRESLREQVQVSRQGCALLQCWFCFLERESFLVPLAWNPQVGGSNAGLADPHRPPGSACLGCQRAPSHPSVTWAPKSVHLFLG